MKITPLSLELIPAVKELMQLGAPFITVRTDSDYWLYAMLFSTTCPVALEGDEVIGAVIAFRSQDNPADIYVQDVLTHPDRRRSGIGQALMGTLTTRAQEMGCARLYLTSDPENAAAHATWCALGFHNLPGDRLINGVSVIDGFKGPGKDRAVYQLDL